MRAAVVGAAITPVRVYGPEVTDVGLAAAALKEALADAGLDRDQVDGVAWNLGRPSGENYPQTIEATGLDVRFINQSWTHGRFTGSTISQAAMAVAAGEADVVACLGGVKRAGAWPSPGGRITGDIVEDYGMEGLAYECALSFQRYLALHGVERDRVADVVLSARAHAASNPNGMFLGPLTRDEYLAAPWQVEPLKTVDCFGANEFGWPDTNYGVCVLVARPEIAAGLAKPPAWVIGSRTLTGGREERYFGLPGLGMFTQTTSTFAPGERELAVYGDAGVEPADVDALYTYDAFSPTVWFTLERFGHCAPGTASSWATEERIGPGGELPVNTDGGILGSGHAAGWPSIVEMVRQLRGDAGPRQLPDARIVQWAAVFGDSFLLTNDEDLWRRAPRS